MIKHIGVDAVVSPSLMTSRLMVQRANRPIGVGYDVGCIGRTFILKSSK